MKMRHWKKLGLIYSPTGKGRHEKLRTHSANPLPLNIKGDVYRIYYSGRDINNKSSVGAIDYDIKNFKIIADHPAPFFEYGKQGSFYSDGVSIGNCYVADGITYMLFMGWQNPKNEHWRGDIGRLIVNEDLSLSLESQEPFMTLDPVDKLSLSYPWVIGNDNTGYIMWYGSTVTWDAGNGEMLHVINYAESADGHNWVRKGLSLPYEIGTAQAFSRPTVLSNHDGTREMWFSYRSGSGTTYRIGHAIGAKDEQWQLDLDGAGIDVSTSGWDSEMIEYPFVLDHKGKRYMFYNGNSYGLTGFGLAVQD